MQHDRQSLLASNGTLLRTLDSAEDAILAAMEWMPYLSDIEAEEPKLKLNAALARVTAGLDLVRRGKREVEEAILKEAKGVY